MNKSRVIKKFTLILLFAFSFLTAASLSSCAAESEMNTAKDLKVEIISPKEGERVHGNITIEARVNHPEQVKYCEFYIQEPGAKDRYGWKDYSPPYFWGGDRYAIDTTLFNDGSASAVVFCLPKDNKSVKFEKRVHFIIDNGKPKIKIISPEDESVVKGKTLIRLDASDSKGIESKSGITAIYIYVDGSLYQKLTKPPFEASISTCLLRQGLHSIRAVVEDSECLSNYDNVIVTVLIDDSVFKTAEKSINNIRNIIKNIEP